MHTYQFWFYHIDIKLFGAFLCVFLSPSLYLALVCSLAPKRKSTLSQNPLHFGASSSSSSPSDSTSSHVRFRDDKARKDFSKNFSQRGIHLEHQVVLSDFSDTDLPTIIYSRGWLWAFVDCVQRESSFWRLSSLAFVRHLHLGVTVKTPLAWALKKVWDSLTWW